VRRHVGLPRAQAGAEGRTSRRRAPDPRDWPVNLNGNPCRKRVVVAFGGSATEDSACAGVPLTGSQAAIPARSDRTNGLGQHPSNPPSYNARAAQTVEQPILTTTSLRPPNPSAFRCKRRSAGSYRRDHSPTGATRSPCSNSALRAQKGTQQRRPEKRLSRTENLRRSGWSGGQVCISLAAAAATERQTFLV